MYVCICNNVTESDIRDAVHDGIRDMKTLSAELGVGTCCGKCKSCAKKVMREAKREIKAEQTLIVLGGALPAPMPEAELI